MIGQFRSFLGPLGCALVAVIALSSQPSLADPAQPVEVVNLPAVQDVKEINGPSRHPFTVSGSGGGYGNGTMRASVPGGWEGVPEGERWIVQHVSLAAHRLAYGTRGTCDLLISKDGGGSVTHYLTVQATHFRGDLDYTRIVASTPIFFALDPGDSVTANCLIDGFAAPSNRLIVTISGYKVAYQAPLVNIIQK